MELETITHTLTQQDQSDPETATITEATDELNAETGPPEVPAVSLDDVFEILSNQRRRHVYWYLTERDEPVSLRDLSEYVAAEENEKPIDQLRSQERKRVYVGLYQCHLPKMDAMGFVQFNKARGIIELGPAAVHAEKFLQQDERSTHQWPTYYLGLVGVSWLLLVGSLVLNPTGIIAATGVILMLLTVLAVVQVYTLQGESASPRSATPTSEA